MPWYRRSYTQAKSVISVGGARPPSKSKAAERSARSRQPSAAAKIKSWSRNLADGLDSA